MNQKTIDTIREAELTADQTEKAASVKHDELIAQAKTQAAEIVKQMTADAKTHAAQKSKAAHVQCDKLQSEALETAKQEIAALHAKSSAREAEAKRLILSELI